MHYLVERQWFSSNYQILLNLFIIFEAKKDNFKELDVIIHGKAGDCILSEDTDFPIPEELQFSGVNDNILITSSLYQNEKFVNLEGWPEGFSVDGNKEEVVIGSKDPIASRTVKVISHENLTFKIDTNYQECSKINIISKNFFEKGKCYLIAFALCLNPPDPKNFFLRMLAKTVKHTIHFYTFKGVSDADIGKFVKEANYFMPLRIWEKENKYTTSTLLVHLKDSQRLINSSIFSPVKSSRYHQPFSPDDIKSEMLTYIWAGGGLDQQHQGEFIIPSFENNPLKFEIMTTSKEKIYKDYFLFFLALLGLFISFVTFFSILVDYSKFQIISVGIFVCLIGTLIYAYFDNKKLKI